VQEAKIGRAKVGFTDGLNPERVGTILANISPDRGSYRGATESRVYAQASPGVVLIATNDALGSGSLIRPDGLILTNLHVVGKNSVVAVVFKPIVEGAEPSKADVRRGLVARRDEVLDLALVKVDDVPAQASVLPLGSMNDISVGADVHAIGHPTGEAWSYTKGIVSQIRHNYMWKADDGLTHTASVIQTQTPINPGNSGGPLLTDAGELVGVNSFKSEGEGLNFAVSVDDVHTLLTETHDRVSRPQRTRATTSADACEPKSYGVTRLDDGSGSRELLDVDCFGKPDAAWILPDDPSKPAILAVDTHHSGMVDAELYSQSRDGKFDYSLWDTTGAGKPDLKCYHKNGSAKPYRCEKI
jgi:S1-C subfamily serine protease